MNNTVLLVIFIIVASTVFPLAGYILDRRHFKKMMRGTTDKKQKETNK